MVKETGASLELERFRQNHNNTGIACKQSSDAMFAGTTSDREIKLSHNTWVVKYEFVIRRYYGKVNRTGKAMAGMKCGKYIKNRPYG